MKMTARGSVALYLLLVISPTCLAQSASELSLGDVLQVALQRGAAATQSQASQPYQASSWLAGLPSVSVSYLESDERDGVDEAELSLNLPIKSGNRRDADKALQGLSVELDELVLLERELYLSGLIREAVWSYRIADARRRSAADKRQLLLQLEQREQELVAANASSSYALLLLQKELVDVEISQQDYLQQARDWLRQYRQVTGLGEIPGEIEEAPPHQAEFVPERHPRILALELTRKQREALVQANSDQASDWNLSLNAKNLSAGNYDEDQYGLALEMPLSFVKMQSQSGNAEWQQASREYSLAREQGLVQLHSQWQALAGEADALAEKQRLLSRAVELTQKIAGQLKDLQASNEIGQEITLRRMMQAIDTQAQRQANQLLIHQNYAMQRQAAGLPL